MSGTNVDTKSRIGDLAKTIPKVHWGRLRFLGNFRVLSISYIIGIALALPSLIDMNFSEFTSSRRISLPLTIYVVGVSLANISYEFFCPTIIKKFEKLPDFYQHQLTIKKLQIETYPEDPFQADLLHVSENYINALSRNSWARYFTLSFYIIGILGLLFFVVELYRAF